MEAKQQVTQYEAEKEQGLRRDDGSKNLTSLKLIHHKALKMHLAGNSNRVIAQRLQKTDATISRWLSDPLIVEILDKEYKANDARFKALYSKTIDVIEDSLNQDKHSIGVNLKGADMYLKAHKKYDPENAKAGDTAEDVIQRMINLNLQFNINSNTKQGE